MTFRAPASLRCCVSLKSAAMSSAILPSLYSSLKSTNFSPCASASARTASVSYRCQFSRGDLNSSSSASFCLHNCTISPRQNAFSSPICAVPSKSYSVRLIRSSDTACVSRYPFV